MNKNENKKSYVAPSADLLSLSIWDFVKGSNELPDDEFEA